MRVKSYLLTSKRQFGYVDRQGTSNTHPILRKNMNDTKIIYGYRSRMRGTIKMLCLTFEDSDQMQRRQTLRDMVERCWRVSQRRRHSFSSTYVLVQLR